MTNIPHIPTFRRSLLVLAVGAAVLCAAAAGAPRTTAAPGAEGVTTVKIVSDLPLRGEDSVATQQMVRAIRFVLAQAGYKAGKYRVQFESFDNTTPTRHEWDERTCARNARSHAADPAVVGVIGPFNSGCSAIEIPILNRVPVAMVSPSNTYAGLTKSVVGTYPDEPATYYPAGGRNYTRIVASEDNEGRIGAMYMKRTLHAKRVFVLNDRSDYGRMNAAVFEDMARKLGLSVVGHDGWENQRKSYTELMTRIKATDADGIYVAGDVDKSGAQLLKDKVAVLGGNTKVKVIVSDGFVYDDVFRLAGASTVEGIVGTAPIAPWYRVATAAGFVRAFGKTERARDLSDWTVLAATATQVLLDAIARSDGSRKDVVAKLFATNRLKTALGPISFDGNGDTKWATESLYKAKNGNWVYIGSRTYESAVKPGRVARGADATAGKTEKAHEVWYAPSLPKAAQFTGKSIRHTRLSDAAYALSKLFGKPKTVNVACWSNVDWPRVSHEDDDVYTTYGIWMWDMPHWLHLSPGTCRAMETLLHKRPTYPNVYTADAVDTLTHELMHALGIDSEAQAECYALQLSVDLAKELGVPDHYAQRLSHLNLENYADLAPEYIDRKRCSENGVWDLAKGKNSPPWHST